MEIMMKSRGNAAVYRAASDQTSMVGLCERPEVRFLAPNQQSVQGISVSSAGARDESVRALRGLDIHVTAITIANKGRNGKPAGFAAGVRRGIPPRSRPVIGHRAR
ncbi:hypothetical protein LX16_3688 [Stackebrandtia albiflava]|uniref:Uncharacterized protein n=1 Tax=Stackebrandtia albiflava TaxID=406432 RepID=A0A562V4V2_9ACTN|nr:hypothetical protein [Stackebrandtia albiflava]TWJ12921.1 hypothetical protein LX16_3688 [Stackebrandtia albiflava]